MKLTNYSKENISNLFSILPERYSLLARIND